MRAHRHLALAVLIAVVTALAASAQFDVNGPNARLTMQGSVPGTLDPVAHDVPVTLPGAFNIRIDSGANPLAGIIMLASQQNPNGVNRIVVPWGGSVDAGNGTPLNIIVIADGISLTVNPVTDIYYRTQPPTAANPQSAFTQSFTVSTTICGLRAAWQAIVADPTAAPFFLDCTECGDANFTIGQQRTLLTGDDGIVNLPFSAGATFPFHGVSYTSVLVCGNGYLAFGATTTVAAAGFTTDAVSWMNAEPSIAVCLTDWGVGNTGVNDGVFVLESGSRLLVSWGDPRALPSGAIGVSHFAGIDTNNQFECAFDLAINPAVNSCSATAAAPGTFTLSYPRFDAVNVAQSGNGIIGHSPGGPAIVGGTVSRDLLGSGPTTTFAGQPAVEEHDRTGTNASTIGWNGAGAPRAFNEVRVWQGNAVTFAPRPALVPGAAGYVATVANPPLDIVTGIDRIYASIAGGTVVNATGKFFGFGAGTVTVTDAAGNTALATIGGITGGTGPVFTNERLSFTMPPVTALGNGTVRFNFPSGYTATFPIALVSPCTTVGPNLTMPPLVGFVNYPLTVPVRMYGTNYTSIFVSGYGTIDMGAGNGLFTPTLASFFNGRGAANNPGIAYLWCDIELTSIATWTVIEDTCAGTVRVDAANLQFWNSLAPAGSFSVTFGAAGADSVRFDYSGAINDPVPSENPVVGYTDGNTTVGSNTNLGLNGGFASVIPGTYTTGMFGSVAPDSVAEQFQSSTYATILGAINGTGIFTIQNNGLGNLTIF